MGVRARKGFKMVRLSTAAAVSLAIVGSSEAFVQSPLMKGPHMAKFSHQATASRRAPALRMAATALPSLAPLPSLADQLPDCPTTKWNVDKIDIAAEQARYKQEGIPESLLTITATAEDNAKGLEFFVENKDRIMSHMQQNGAVILKNFELSKKPDGFRRVWETLGLAPCLDPIHSSGLRSFLSARDGVYEEVNKQSLAKHYIGLHNESTFKKTAAYGAFVCFSPASVSGGEFFIADGAKIFRDLRQEVVEDLYTRGVRISVSNLDLGIIVNGLGPLKENAKEFFKGVVDKTVAPKFDMDLDMIYGTDGKPERLQAIEHKQSPINRHPESGQPVWFCNIHNHARYLRDRRPCSVPEVGMTDVYYGDLSLIGAETLEHINEVSNKHIQNLAMEPGDVLLIDNYRMLHGRQTFEGDRLHAVSWFRKGDETDLKVDKPNPLNALINQFIK